MLRDVILDRRTFPAAEAGGKFVGQRGEYVVVGHTTIGRSAWVSRPARWRLVRWMTRRLALRVAHGRNPVSPPACPTGFPSAAPGPAGTAWRPPAPECQGPAPPRRW